jgi:prevent-host-death family protein
MIFALFFDMARHIQSAAGKGKATPRKRQMRSQRACIALQRRPAIGIERLYMSRYTPAMTTIPIREAKNRLTELARRVEDGERFTVSRNGKPVMELVPAPKKGGLDLEGFERYKRENGMTDIIGFVSDDFDDPLPEDFPI